MSYEYALGTYGLATDTNCTTFPEERRQWRVHIEDHITEKAEEINDNVDEAEATIVDRVDEAETNLDNHITTVEQKVDTVNTYLVNTIKPKLDSIETKINNVNSYVTGTLKTYVDELEPDHDAQDTMLQKIWNKVSVLPNSWNWGY